MLEAEITAGLETRIVPVYGLGRYSDGRPYYAMRFIQGDSLRIEVRRYHSKAESGRLSKFELRHLLQRFLAVCDTANDVHSRGVLHRDLKPSNIMLGPFGETLVVDWGLAKILGAGSGDSDAASAKEPPTIGPADAEETGDTTAIGTMAGAVVGTPAYMSPEQARGALAGAGAVDRHLQPSATLYEILTGKPPFTDREFAEVCHKVTIGDFPPPRMIDKRIPRTLEAICLKAMSLRPKDRYSTAGALSRDIACWLADESVSAYRENFSQRVWRYLRRTRIW